MGNTALAKTTPSRPGPKTAVGQIGPRVNAVRHGIMSKMDVLPWESQSSFTKFVKKRVDFFQMSTEYEKDLVRFTANQE